MTKIVLKLCTNSDGLMHQWQEMPLVINHLPPRAERRRTSADSLRWHQSAATQSASNTHSHRAAKPCELCCVITDFIWFSRKQCSPLSALEDKVRGRNMRCLTETYMKAEYTSAPSQGTLKTKGHILKMRQKQKRAYSALINESSEGWHKYFCHFEGF